MSQFWLFWNVLRPGSGELVLGAVGPFRFPWQNRNCCFFFWREKMDLNETFFWYTQEIGVSLNPNVSKKNHLVYHLVFTSKESRSPVLSGKECTPETTRQWKIPIFDRKLHLHSWLIFHCQEYSENLQAFIWRKWKYPNKWTKLILQNRAQLFFYRSLRLL